VLWGGSLRAQTIRTWNGSINSDWFNPTNWTPSGVPASNDTVNFNSGAINLTAPVMIDGQFNWVGGSLGGSLLTVGLNGVLNWSGGQLSTGASVTVATNGTLNITGSLTLFGAITNFGTVVWSTNASYPIYGYGGVVIYNAGLWQMTADGTISAQGGTNIFINVGTIQKTGGTGTTTIGWTFNTTGIINTPSGILAANNWTGSNLLQGTANLSFNHLNANLVVASNSVLNWVGGDISGAALTIAAGGTLTISNTVSMGTSGIGGAITNYGTVNWAAGSSGPFYGYSGSTIYNGGLWEATTNDSLSNQSGTNTFINAGTLTEIGANTLNMGWTFNTVGIVNGAAGQLSTGPWTGNSLLQGTVNLALSRLNTNLTVASNAVLNWVSGDISAGALTVAAGGTLTISNSVTMGASGFGGALTNYGTVYWTAGPSYPFYGYSGSVIYNAGLWQATADDSLSNQSGTNTFNNAGTFQKTNSTGNTTIGWFFTTTGLVATSSGSLILNNWNGISVLNGTPNINGGTINGTVTVGPGSALSDTGNLNIRGPVLVSSNAMMTWNGGDLSSAALTVAAGGVLTISNSVSMGSSGTAGALTNYGSVLWTAPAGSPLYGYGSVIYNAGLWQATTDDTLNNQLGTNVFINVGTFQKTNGTGNTTVGWFFTTTGLLATSSGSLILNNWSGINVLNGTPNINGGTLTGTLTVAAGSTLNDTGNLNIRGPILVSSNAAMIWVEGDLSGAALTVAAGGILTVSNGVSMGSSGNSGALTNYGTVVWATPVGGPWYFYYGSVVYNGNLWQAAGDSAMINETGTNAFNNVGTFQKVGTTGTTSIGIPFINSGTLDAQSGTISFGGSDYVQTGATMDFGLRAPGASGQVGISGNLGLDGTVELEFLNGYTPQAGDSFTLVSYTSHSGVYNTLNLPPAGTNLAWLLAYGASAITLQAVSATNFASQITGSVMDTLGHAVTNISVFAASTNATNNLFVSANTDGAGHYALNVTNGVFEVGVQGLAARGYNAVSNQIVVINNSNQVVNFVLQLTVTTNYTVTVSVNPAGGGSATGGGTFASGSTVTLTAFPTNSPPYLFVDWRENGVFESSANPYVFVLDRDRQMTANFALPVFSVTATNNPAGGGNITGAGSFSYGTTNVLIATPNFGYNFANWTEGTNIVGTNTTLTTIVVTNHSFAANYSEANTNHFVTTATSPPGLATLAGAGIYTNGQTANIIAPGTITNPPTLYTFQYITLNNAVVSFSTNYSKTFSTVDPTNFQYVAVYSGQSIRPLIAGVSANFNNPVPATNDFILSLRFDRTMATNVLPIVTLTNSAAGALQPTVPTNGSWTSVVVANDTYQTPPIAFIHGMDGTNLAEVSGAQDLFGDTLAPTNAYSVVVDATPPVISNVASAPSVTSAFVTWNTDKPASSDVEYGTNVSYGSFTPLDNGLVTAHGVTVSSLNPLTTYHFRVHSHDLAGNETISGDNTFTTFAAPDLMVTNLSVTGTLISGNTLQISWTDTNAGAGATFTYWYDEVEVTNITTGQTLLNTAAFYDPGANGNIAPGGFHNRQLTFTLPDGGSGAGTLEFIIIVNAYNTQYESNNSGTAQSNNVASITRSSALAAYPDLQVTGLAVTNGQIQSGNTVGILWNDLNSGTGPVTNSFQDEVTVVNQTTAQTLVNTFVPYSITTSGQIGTNQSVSRQFAFTLPQETPGAGNLQITVTVDAFNNVFEYNASGSAETNNTSSIVASSSLAPSADLMITNIVSPTNANAGQSIQISWTDVNQGNAAASGTWYDEVFLSNTNVPGGGQLIGTFAFTNGLATNGSAMVTQTVTLPQFVQGNQWIIVKANATGTIFELNPTNNAVVAGQPINVVPTLQLNLSSTTVSESAGTNSMTLTVIRNGNLAGVLNVALSTLTGTNVYVPTNAVIPAGHSSVSVAVGPIDNFFSGSPVNETISASAAGFATVGATLTVLENDPATLTLALSAGSVNANAGSNALTGTVTRNANYGQALTVALSSDIPSAITVPPSVVIPAGQASAHFGLSPVPVTGIGDSQRANIYASAAGFSQVSAAVMVLNTNAPQLSLELEFTMVAKGSGNSADIGTVSVPSSLLSAQNVLLTVESNSLVTVPAVVTIPAGATSVNFDIAVTNDFLVTGTQTAILLAQLLTPSQTAISNGETSATLEILDVNGPTLSLSVSNTTIPKGSNTTVTVTRNTSPTNALTVNLASSPAGIVSMPTNITLGVSQTSAVFTVTAILDQQQTGPELVALTASATNFNPGAAPLTVSDIYLPDLVPTAIIVPSNAPAGSQLTLSWVITNKGLGAATNANWYDAVYLSSSSAGQSQTLSATANAPAALPIGASYTNQASIALPPTPGSYWVIVQADAGNALTELNKQNNTLVSPTPVVVSPPWRAAITNATPAVAPQGTPIVLSGWTYNPANNQPAPNKTATVSIQVNGTIRSDQVVSDANGAFTYTFQPLQNEAGDYTAGADYPFGTQPSAQVAFVILGMQALPASFTTQLLPNAPLTNQIVLSNLTDHALHGLAFTVPNLQGKLSAQFTFTNTTLAANGTMSVSCILTSPLTQSAQVNFTATATSTEGAQVIVPFNVTVMPLVAQLIGNPGYLVSGTIVGQQTVLSFDIFNSGGAPSGDLTVQLPNLSWMTLGSTATIPSIPAGGKATVTLILDPPSNLPQALYTGNVVIGNGNTSLNMPFQIRAVSSAVGELLITATDDYTYYQAGSPKVTNALIVVRDPATGNIVAQTNSDANGMADFAALPAGPYTVDATAAQHNQFHGSVTVAAGVATPLETFLPRRLVTYQWTVVPTDVPDQYQIVLQTLFETEVPVPNVVVSEPNVLLPIVPGEVSQFVVTLSNHGLIQAENVGFTVPNDPTYLVTPLVTNVGIIPAQASVKVPVTVQLRGSLAQFQKNGGGRPREEGCTPGDPPCVPELPMQFNYDYLCGNNHVARQGTIDMSFICTAQEVKDCIDKVRENLESENLASLTCNTIEEIIACSGVHLTPCKKAAISGVCAAAVTVASDGALGESAIPGALSDALGCLCDKFPDIPLPFYPFGSGGGPGYVPPVCNCGGIIYSIFTGYSIAPRPAVPPTWQNVIYDPVVQTSVPGSDCSAGTIGGGEAALKVATPVTAGAIPRLRPAQKRDLTSGVCAQILLQISQSVVMTRSAFSGSLTLDDGGSTALSDIKISLAFQDGTNGDASSKFVVEGPVLNTLTAVDGSGTLGGGGTGSATYTFIPTDDAAPTAPVTYKIGGNLTYSDGGQQVTVPLLSTPITVYPEAKLNLLYFEQRDVYGPDPLDPQISVPSQPFDLGLIVKNIGAGTAHNFQITSSQPKIVDNEKGLLIDFTITGTEVGDQPVTPSLTATLGDIAPGGVQVATWDLLSSLAGKFLSLDATFQHLDDMGNTNTSLINSVEIHSLIHRVLANRTNDDDIPDFLANDIPNPGNLPDTLYLSDGSIAAVNVITNGAFDGVVVPGHLQVHLTTTVSNGWNYIQLPDPGPGYLLASVVRSDGEVLSLTNDAWTTALSFPSSSLGPVPENLVHLFDWAGTGSYTLHYRSTDTTPPAIVQLGPVTPFTQPSPVSSVNIVFTEPIDTTTFAPGALTLTVNGSPNLITGGNGVTLTLVSNATYSIAGLQPLTAADGNYELDFNGAAIYDLLGNNAGNVSASVRWAQGNAPVVVQSISAVSPNPRNQPVSSVTVTFSRPINPATFTYQTVNLTLNNGPNLANNSITIAQQSATTFLVGGLGPLTGAQGNYVLSVNAAAVQDTNGTGGFSSQSVTWTTITTGPTITALQPITTNPRNIVVQSLNVTFSEPIDPTTFDYNDISLTLDGGSNLVTSAVEVVPLSSTNFMITNISSVQGYAGTYTLTVNAGGVADLAGNPGSGSTNESWQMILETPPPPTNLVITPDLGISSSDGLTSTNNITLSGTLGASNLAVQVFDATSATSLGAATVNGTNFSIALAFTTEGMHRLQANAVDGAGNVSLATFLNVFLDAIPPTAIIQQVANPSYFPVTNILVTFSKGIITNTISATNFSITLNGTNRFAPTLTYISSNEFSLGNLGTFTAPLGTYQVSLFLNGVQDYAGNTSGNVVTMSWVHAPYAPPVITAVSNLTVTPNTAVSVHIQATDPNGYPLTYSLGPGAQPGAAIAANTGVFTWTPTCQQGTTTNLITVWATDGAPSPLSNSVSFTITVTTCIQFQAGSTVMQAGATSSVPVSLVSSAALTNLSFGLVYPTNRFTGWSFVPSNSAISSVLVQSDSASQTRFTLGVTNGRTLQGQVMLGSIGFAALPGPSAFLSLMVTNIAGTATDGTAVGNGSGQSGRVVLIGPQPLLEAGLGGRNSRTLTLYGNPGSSYAIQWETNVLAGSWTTGWRVPMTNLLEKFTSVGEDGPIEFYRAYQFTAAPPILEWLQAAGARSLVIYGVAGTNYTLQTTTNLNSPASWTNQQSFSTTNSFYIIPGIQPTNRVLWFRIRQP
jgi:CARDB/Divergent InlB B-repeat domain/Bacterial Ig-like domain